MVTGFERVLVAKDTLKTVKKGMYTINGETIRLPRVEKGQYFDLLSLNELVNTSKVEMKKGECTYELKNKDIVTAVLEETEDKVGVLNFASAHNPGGGFKKGAMAQEEALCYCSNLYDTIFDSDFYTEQGKRYNGSLYLDVMIASDVTFFRNSAYEYVSSPKSVKVVTSAAVNVSACPKNRLDDANSTMKIRMRKILNLFINQGCDTLLLGAFGCGVFGNDPYVIANIWIDLLKDEHLEDNFKKIVFVVLSPNFADLNFTAFERVLQSRIHK